MAATITKKMLKDALHLARQYCVSDTIPFKIKVRVYNKLQEKCDQIADLTSDFSCDDIYAQAMDKARELPRISMVPGKDY